MTAPQPRRRHDPSDEGGFVIVWIALMLVVLVAWIGFAVDVGMWYFTANRVQKAADAAALAGVVYMPGGVISGGGGPAVDEALHVAADNHYPDGPNTVVVQQGARPNELRVTITTKVNNGFASLLGVTSTTIKRSAVAEYDGPVPMGSPENRLGNNPETGFAPHYWINLAGPNATKVNGDRYAAKNCDSSVSYCTDGAVPPNNDYATEGYAFTVRVKAPQPAPLQIQVYDPEMTYTGDHCDGIPPGKWPDASQRSDLAKITDTPTPPGGLPSGYYADQTRYAPPGDPGGYKWCSGDTAIGGADMNTTILVRAPDNTPSSDADNPVIDTPTCKPQFFPAIDIAGGPPIRDRLDPSKPQYQPYNLSDGVWTVTETWRRWVTVCTIPTSDLVVGDYIVQVRSNAQKAAPTVYDPTIATGGHNRMALQVGYDTGTAGLDGTGVQIFANGKLPIYANDSGASTTFYLARVVPGGPGRTLNVDLFDIGDAAGGAGILEFDPPAGNSFPSCSFRRDEPPKGPDTIIPSVGCTISGVGGDYNGKDLKVAIPIPDTYNCNPNDPLDCWVTVKATFPGGVEDTTTWSAVLNGNPVRIVE